MSLDNFFSVPLKKIIPNCTLPFNVYLFINNHFILYKKKEDEFEDEVYSRLQMKRVKFLFIDENERELFEKYNQRLNKIDEAIEEAIASPIGKSKNKIEGNLEDIIEKGPIEENIKEITDLASSGAKELVEELKKKPYSSKLLSHLTAHSHGIYSHSTNTSTLAIHLAMKMGYHQDHVLENIGSAGLLHDIGKIKINIDLLNKGYNKYTPDELRLLRKHPEIGRGLLLSVTGSPEEVRLMVYQHHETHDGNGYPEGIRGSKIFELTKILAIANTVEHLFQGLKTKENFSIDQVIELTKKISHRFDPRTLNKALAVLKDF